MKPYTLTNREGESISPMTSTKTVFDERGTDLDTLLSQQRQDSENALKDYAKKAEVTQGLNAKQDRLSTTTDLHITDDNIIGLTELAKMRLFCDLFNAAAGSYGYARIVNDAFECELNGLTLTYEEAMEVYDSYHKGVDHDEAISKFAIRTNIPIRAQWNCSLIRYAQGNVTVEVLNLPMNLMLNNNQQAFYGCTNLRKVYGLYHINGTIDQGAFYNCKKLEYVAINKLMADLRLDWSPLLSLESLSYLVTNAANTSAITITVHPDVYAKLTGDTTNEAAASLTPEELAQWGQVLTDAVTKNISFATV